MAITRLGGANAITGTIPQGNIANASLGAVTTLPSAIATGKVLQVVTVTDTTGRSTTGTSFALNSSSLTLNITPSSTSSKILVHLSCLLYINNSSGRLTIFRDSTNLGGSGANDGFIVTDGDAKYFATSGVHIIDSPSSTSAVNYQIRFKSDNGQTVTVVGGGMLNSLTLMEIEA